MWGGKRVVGERRVLARGSCLRRAWARIGEPDEVEDPVRQNCSWSFGPGESDAAATWAAAAVSAGFPEGGAAG